MFEENEVHNFGKDTCDAYLRLKNWLIIVVTLKHHYYVAVITHLLISVITYTLNRSFGINSNEEGNKLCTYKLFAFENYLLHIKDWNLRKNLTTLCISAHNLYIEKLRYNYLKIPVKDRLCDTCKVIEDEQDVVMYCTRFEASRSRLLKDINEIYV